MKRRTYFRKPLIFETYKACGEIHKHAESDSTLGFYEPIATANLVIAINGVMDSIGKVKKQNDQPDQDYKNCLSNPETKVCFKIERRYDREGFRKLLILSDMTAYQQHIIINST